MNESEEIREAIDLYLMERYKYRRSLVRLTPDHIVTIRRNSRIDLYLRIRRTESLFPSDCLIIARLGFGKIMWICGELFEEMQCGTQNRARLPSHYLDQRKSPLKALYPKAYK